MKRRPEPTSADLKRWKRLVREAGLAADDIGRPMGDLADAERLAKSSVALGVLTRENPCIQLVRQARQFVAETLRGRRALQPRLLELSVLVGEAIAAAERPPEPGRRRRDIFE